MGDILRWSQSQIRQVITESNKQSAIGSQKYVKWENQAIHSDYEFIECPCDESCWCRQNLCSGHYRIKEISFEQYLKTYVNLWVPPHARENVRRAVVEGNPFHGRQRNAVPCLSWLRDNWPVILQSVRLYNKCGLCNSSVPLINKVDNLYEAKMWSQLFYDSVVPFDTKSRAKIKKAGYIDPMRDYLAMNKALFQDLRVFSTANGLGVSGIRRLDSPWSLGPEFRKPVGDQPLSRVLDKMFYSPI